MKRQRVSLAPSGLRASASRPASRAARRLLEGALWSLALLTAAYLSYVALDRIVHQARQASGLRAAFAAGSTADVATHSTEAATAIRWQPLAGEPIGLLEIPLAGVSTMVSAGTDALTLRRGIGHITGTALPGEPGNVGLAGHRDTAFRGLRKLRPGDRITLRTAFGSFDYAVESIRTVAPERVDVLDPSEHPTLTLVTCFPFDYIGAAPLRFVLRALEVGRSGAAPRAADAERESSSAPALGPRS